MATWISITLIAWVALSVVVSMVMGGIIRIADGRRDNLSAGAQGATRHPLPTPLSRVS